MWLVQCNWTYPFAVSAYKATCPELAAGEPGLPASARAAPTIHGSPEMGVGAKAQTQSSELEQCEFQGQPVRKEVSSCFSPFLTQLRFAYLLTVIYMLLTACHKIHAQFCQPCFRFFPVSEPLRAQVVNPASETIGICPGSRSILPSCLPWLFKFM